jgi:hypothetical protein
LKKRGKSFFYCGPMAAKPAWPKLTKFFAIFVHKKSPFPLLA